MSKKINNKGFTLIELIVSIAVASILLSMLMQMLVVSVQARNQMAVNSRLQDEAYLITETIKWNIFENETQSVSYAYDAVENTYTVSFHHDWDLDPSLPGYVASGQAPDTLVFDVDANELLYNGIGLHSSSVYIDAATTLSVDPIDTTCIPDTEKCKDVVLTINLNISYYVNGSLVEIKQFETTIII